MLDDLMKALLSSQTEVPHNFVYGFRKTITEHYTHPNGEGPLIYLKNRESPLYFAEWLTEHYKRPNGEGPLIYLKREDLNHTGAGAGQHGVAMATVCAVVLSTYMGAQDMERQSLNVFRMRLLGAEVRAVHSGTATLKDAMSDAIRDWVTNVETTHYILGSVAGPHPYSMMVREFHAVIGKETIKQALEKWGGKPDDVRLIGVAWSYVQIVEPHSISAGLDYSGVGPEHSFLKVEGHAEYCSDTDDEALEEISLAGNGIALIEINQN
ncbi:hypothetical protein EZV62_009180 [Acer yangbiense]|uniref:Tryptophan synthase n=1 Tax=Acer yangbiense TaxID=1000413 RepID=A0A5C7IFW0_9ROSI|nr:hypothetical protein EZV62_009180 [Acer yangbiense]